MLELTYLLIFYISGAYAGITYFFAFFLDHQLSPLPFGAFTIVAILFCFVKKTPSYRINTKSFKSAFLKMVFAFFIPLIGFTVLYKGEAALPSLSVATPYLIVFLTDSVLLLQLLRHQSGTNDHKTFSKYQRKQALAFFGFTFLGTVCRLFELIWHAINLFIFKPIGYVIFAAMSSLSQSVEDGQAAGLVNNNSYNDVLASEKEKADFDGVRWHDVVTSILGDNKETAPETHTNPILMAIIITVLALVMIFLFILFIKNISKDRKKVFTVYEEREDSTEESTAMERLKKHFAPPDIQIRYYYKEFMKKSETERLRLIDADTTQDIMNKYLHNQSLSNDGKGEEHSKEQARVATSITNLYRKTRYSTSPATKEEASIMKKLMKSC